MVPVEVPCSTSRVVSHHPHVYHLSDPTAIHEGIWQAARQPQHYEISRNASDKFIIFSCHPPAIFFLCFFPFPTSSSCSTLTLINTFFKNKKQKCELLTSELHTCLNSTRNLSWKAASNLSWVITTQFVADTYYFSHNSEHFGCIYLCDFSLSFSLYF